MRPCYRLNRAGTVSAHSAGMWAISFRTNAVLDVRSLLSDRPWLAATWLSPAWADWRTAPATLVESKDLARSRGVADAASRKTEPQADGLVHGLSLPSHEPEDGAACDGESGVPLRGVVFPESASS